MNRTRAFAKNIGLFFISGFGPKIIVFLLVPLYTRCLTTNEYGIADIITTTVSLLYPFVVLCVQNSLLRFCFDNEYNKQDLLMSSIYIFFRGIVFAIIGTSIVAVLPFFDFKIIYGVHFIILLIAGGLYDILSYYCRGINRVNVVVEMSLITTGSSCIFNILFLLLLRFGINGYLVANYLGTLLAVIWGCLRIKAWTIIDFSLSQKNTRRELTKYGFPLIFNKIGWWINTSADRYIVTWMLGAGANGIYSVSYKIPTILTACSDVFSQAWTLSVLGEVNSNDQKSFIKNMYGLFNSFLIICCSLIILINIPLATFLYADSFFIAWKYVPPLLISVLFGGLSGFFGSLYSADKNTKIISISTIIGGITNVCLNLLLIYYMNDAMGAAIATMLSSIVIWFVRLVGYLKYDLISAKQVIGYIILIVQFLASVYLTKGIAYFFQGFILLFLIFFYFQDYRTITAKMISIMKNIMLRRR